MLKVTIAVVLVLTVAVALIEARPDVDNLLRERRDTGNNLANLPNMLEKVCGFVASLGLDKQMCMSLVTALRQILGGFLGQ